MLLFCVVARGNLGMDVNLIVYIDNLLFLKPHYFMIVILNLSDALYYFVMIFLEYQNIKFRSNLKSLTHKKTI